MLFQEKRKKKKQGWEVQGLGPRFKDLRFAFLLFLGVKRLEVQGSTCKENFFKV
jgi:hypothetical protein